MSVVPSAFWLCPGEQGSAADPFSGGQRPAEAGGALCCLLHTWKEEKARWQSPPPTLHPPPACLLGSTGTPISARTQLPLLCEQAGLVSGSFSLLSLSLFYSSKRSWRVPSLFNETLQVRCRFCSLWAFLAIWRGQRRPPMKLRPHFDLPALLCFCWCTLSQRSEWSVQATRGASAGWGWDDIPRECSRPRCKQWSGFSAVSWKPSVLWFLVLAVQ